MYKCVIKKNRQIQTYDELFASKSVLGKNPSEKVKSLCTALSLHLDYRTISIVHTSDDQAVLTQVSAYITHRTRFEFSLDAFMSS